MYSWLEKKSSVDSPSHAFGTAARRSAGNLILLAPIRLLFSPSPSPSLSPSPSDSWSQAVGTVRNCLRFFSLFASLSCSFLPRHTEGVVTHHSFQRYSFPELPSNCRTPRLDSLVVDGAPSRLLNPGFFPPHFACPITRWKSSESDCATMIGRAATLSRDNEPIR